MRASTITVFCYKKKGIKLQGFDSHAITTTRDLAPHLHLPQETTSPEATKIFNSSETQPGSGVRKGQREQDEQEKTKAAAGEEKLSSLLPTPTGMVFLLKRKSNFLIVFPPNPTLPKGKASGLAALTPKFLHHHRPGCRKSLCVAVNTEFSRAFPGSCRVPQFPHQPGGRAIALPCL